MTGLEIGTGNENVILWSLAESKALCKVSVPPQVAAIKISYPDVIVCGHLDGIITIIRFKPRNIPARVSNKSYNAPTTQESSPSQLQYLKITLRGHTSAVISLEINQVRDSFCFICIIKI